MLFTPILLLLGGVSARVRGGISVGCVGYPVEVRTGPLPSLGFDALIIQANSSSALLFASHSVPAPRIQSALRCVAASDDALCDVRLISLQEVASDHFTLRLTFSHSTLEPPMHSEEALRRFVDIEGGGWQGMSSATWTHPSELILTSINSTSATSARVVQVLHVFTPTSPSQTPGCLSSPSFPQVPHIDLQTTDSSSSSRSSLTGSSPQCALRLTPAAVGSLHLSLCAWRSPLHALGTATSPSALPVAMQAWHSHTACVLEPLERNCPCSTALEPPAPLVGAVVSIEPCGTGPPLIVGSLASSAGAAPGAAAKPEGVEEPQQLIPPLPLPKPKWAFSGGVAAVGDKGLRIPSGNLPPRVSSWSVCFWVWVWQGPGEGSAAQRVRALLFKGPGGGSQERTPSAWFAEGATRLLLRVSTNASVDEGGVSTGEAGIPVRAWTHVAFVFKRGDDGGTPFTYTMYVNSILDTEITVLPTTLVRDNDGPLWVGRDAGQFLGVRGLIARFAVYSDAFTSQQVQQEFSRAARVLSPHSPLSASAAAAAALPPAESLLLHGITSATTLAEAWGVWAPQSEAEHAASAKSLAAGLNTASWREALARNSMPYSPAITTATTPSSSSFSSPPSLPHAVSPCVKAAVGLQGGQEDEAQCASPALLEAWGWALGYLNVGLDQNLAFTHGASAAQNYPGSDGVQGHALYSPRWLHAAAPLPVAPLQERRSPLQRALELFSPGGNCSVPFSALKRAYSVLEEAAALGGGPPEVCRVLAHQKLTPGRHWCPEELRREAWRWAEQPRHLALPSTSGGGSGVGGHVPPLRAIVEILSLPLTWLGGVLGSLLPSGRAPAAPPPPPLLQVWGAPVARAPPLLGMRSLQGRCLQARA